MTLYNIKVTLGVAWLLVAAVIGLAAAPGTAGGWFTWLSIGIAPPLAMWLLWNDPSPTMSETISKARR